MVMHRNYHWILFIGLFVAAISVHAQQAGSIRGMVYDNDFNVPLAGAMVAIAETGASAIGTDEGNYVFGQVPPGSYTLIFSKDGYTRQVKANVVVVSGQMTEMNASLSGDFTEMEEFVVQDIQIGSGTEAGLLQLRMDSPALMDSISADLMSKAGAGDAASALKLVSGATVQDGKYAVIRGLPDRYVNSQMNGIRLPSADADKRAVQLDQFASAAIQSIQVTKTFTPDQQGDASGGAVNVVLKDIPDKAMFKINTSTSYNTQVTGNEDFISEKDGGLGFLGTDADNRSIPNDRLGGNWDGSVGTSPGDPPIDYKWSMAAGGKYEFLDGIKFGGFGSLFYQRNSSFFDNGINDKYWVETPGAGMTPQYGQGTPSQGSFLTSLFDVTQAKQEVKWGGLGRIGLETEHNWLYLTYLYTQSTDDVATRAEDTRGKAYYFPDYNPSDPTSEGNQQRDAAPYLRTETLQYTERVTETLQLNGRHKLPDPGLHYKEYFELLGPEFDWSVSKSSSSLNQPDKRQFGEQWWGPKYNPGYPVYGIPPTVDPEVHRPYKPAANFTVGNLQRVWKDINEDSDQYSANLKIPFNQWTGNEGYLKFGIFNDNVLRDYNQDSFSNFNDNQADYFGPWDDQWSERFPDENHPITAGNIDVDYQGEQEISAWYYMADLPLNSWLRIIGGTRFEQTDLSIINVPESDVTWIPPGASGSVTLNPGDADVMFQQKDALPSLGFILTPLEKVTLRGTYSETVARQTFKELSPIQQQEFLGGDVFIGNPALQMSALKNYDLRLDYTPFDGSLISVAYFFKDVQNPIEYVQRVTDFSYTTPMNFPEGELSGYELEIRQQIEQLWKPLGGLTLGANATLIDSTVTLPAEESAQFDQVNIDAPTKTRDMTNAPNHLYNLFLTYELEKLGLKGTELGLFYTIRGDTLVAGAGQSSGKYIPDIYEKEFGTLNLSLNQKLGETWKIQFQAKNLLDPKIESVYRSKYLDSDVTKTSYKKGIEFSIGVSAEF